MKLPQLVFPNQVLLAYYQNIQARQAPTINAIHKHVKVFLRACLLSDCYHSKANALFHKVPCSYVDI